MREIIHIHIGQCGTQIGSQYWETISEEHNIDPSRSCSIDSDLPTQGLQLCYNETISNTYTPRSIFVDLEPGITDSIQAGLYGRLFKPENFIAGKLGTGNIFAKGFYSEGVQLSDRILDTVRREAEYCDSLQGFQITHSIGGGTGSGLGSHLITKLKEIYPADIVSTFSVFPSKKVSDSVIEPYNALLGARYLMSETDETQIFDNEALYNFCARTRKLGTPTYNDFNQLISAVMAGVTCVMRFPGQISTNMKKLGVSLIPFPRLHFLMLSYAPIASGNLSEPLSTTACDLIQQTFDPGNFLCAVDPRHGKYMTTSTRFRGKFAEDEIDEHLTCLKNKTSSSFCSWLPNNMQASICDILPKGVKFAATTISNSTAVSSIFERIHSRYLPLFSRKAFLHWYTIEGLNEMEFIEAESCFFDLLSEYMCYQDINDEEDEDEDFEGNNDNPQF